MLMMRIHHATGEGVRGCGPLAKALCSGKMTMVSVDMNVDKGR